MNVRKAVIVAAGLGTRMLPASKVIPKEILPVIDTPAIQVIVEEAVASGIEEIIVVVSPGKTLVLDHFQPALDLERHLERKGGERGLERGKLKPAVEQRSEQHVAAQPGKRIEIHRVHDTSFT